MKVLLSLIFLLIFLTAPVFAAGSLDRVNKPLASLGTVLHMQNQKVCDRFQEDVNKLAAIMEQLRDRQGITETRVAFGGVDTPIESADYSITYAAEALAYQRAQEHSTKSDLRYSLETLKNKIIKAKNEVREVLE